MEQTIAAISTSTMSSGGISIVRISGENAISVADTIFEAKNNKKLSKAKQLDYAIKIDKNEKKVKAFEKYLNKELNKDEI